MVGKLKRVRVDDCVHMQQDSKGSSATPESDENNAQQETSEEYAKRLDRLQKEREEYYKEAANSGMASILKKMRVVIEPSDDEDEDELERDAGISDSEWEGEHPTPQTHQPDNEKGYRTPESGYGSDDNVQSKPTSPLHFSAPKAGKLQVPPKSASLHTRPESPLIEKENGAGLTSSKLEEPSAFPVNKQRNVKDLASFWESRS